MEPSQKIILKDSGVANAGRGVFATITIAEGELIESCPVIELTSRWDRRLLKLTELRNYYFLWGEPQTQVAVALGYGSLYNHSYSPNAKYKKLDEEKCINFYAIRDIAPGDEILVNYNGTPTDKTPLWIKEIPLAE
ncbi:MAG: SET domain-containing protein [Patescibacteria group bacterium]